jgi:hypothetical protein
MGYEAIKDCSYDMIADMCCDSGVPRELVWQVVTKLNNNIN